MEALAKAKKTVRKISPTRAGIRPVPDGKPIDPSKRYWTPDQVELIVSTACEKTGLLTKFDMHLHERDTNGTLMRAALTVFHVPSGESIVFETITSLATISNTNKAQQLGGTMTYAERYLKMTAFGIHENSVDPDANQYAKSGQQSVPSTSSTPLTLTAATVYPTLNKEQMDTLLYYLMANDEKAMNAINRLGVYQLLPEQAQRMARLMRRCQERMAKQLALAPEDIGIAVLEEQNT